MRLRVFQKSLAIGMALGLVSGPALAHGDRPWGDGHHHRLAIPTTVTLNANGSRGFSVLVRPNRLSRAEAVTAAGQRGAIYCQQQSSGTRVVLSNAQRYSDTDLESWSFRGACR